ncbi:MAG: Fur family transcriptional regulator, peroxide stress response regulator [Petroclostridium sp.]|jgi:Fur family peroxide stress response transcriptional regulator|uniref:Fur family transcriptional regulator n=1 Tax=Petroclostridium xylanilyticum TaxID=1792311 RepID=UPI000B989BDE|nr:Fur family transcriptional regulator [Petroclostridium xylanilyticum]MBZ4645433.1 ferric uptake regulator, Fur family [Clostridia bacterium]MDK2810974.1 Fur family transcriptional regulator, peroxide stress response regulator [Petroclostridium sp.]
MIKNISEYLIDHNIKPSYPRIKIYEYLVTKKNHPTVDEIYSELVKELPTLSKTTVYNTLDLLIDANIARVVTIEENETRYDADISDHGHFKCEKCGHVFDFQIHVESIETKNLDGFKINEKNVYYKGICPKCLLNKN